MEELMQFDGVGPKTASCVLLFCLRRPSFAVDTHVFRITKALGWVPKEAGREEAHRHLDVRVPEELMYGLHVLLIKHGKTCTNCAARGKPQQPPVGPCPIKEFMGKTLPKDVEVKEEEFGDGAEGDFEDVVGGMKDAFAGEGKKEEDGVGVVGIKDEGKVQDGGVGMGIKKEEVDRTLLESIGT
ncbi:hypothetical protein HK097_004790 [Rhizophlyctis rosea]|uniref:HhH-GPD domain-containing protein n=1 Tax=Rhizophlyctis rosea TaxID=64517 RepID=A0AAD5S108_9FUNG|nr:hypothetical protein HK097_004790 [Rhizophlyctis rosea]